MKTSSAVDFQGREEKGRKDNKEEKLRRLLAEPELTAPPLKDGEYIPIPLDPNIAVRPDTSLFAWSLASS